MNNNRGLKTRTTISNAVDTELLNQLKDLSKQTQIPMSKLLDNAIKLLLESYKTTK
jgi:post-segregation antitoxin (ccd killing protein)